MGKDCCGHNHSDKNAAQNVSKDNEAIIHDTHSSEKFPLFLKIVWVLLMTWGIFYLILYSFPDLKKWL
jgi:hypothetical protein